jgi:4-amino-4-deoxy-L-arabinose transferase-like glycosyltransferase
VPLLVYLALALPNLTLPGVYYDEVLQALPAMRAVGYPLNPDFIGMPRSVVGIGDFKIPLMTTNYLGALETMAFLPVFALVTPTIITIRLTFIILGMIALALIYGWARQLFGAPGALAVALLVATDATFVFYTRADNGPVNTMLIIKLGMLIAYTHWWRTGQKRSFLLGCFLLGLGVYDKANFLWLIAAGVAALALFMFREIRGRLFACRRLLAVGLFLAAFGASPFLGTVLLTGGGPFRGMLQSFNSTALRVNNSNMLGNLGVRAQSFVDITAGTVTIDDYMTSFSGVKVPFERFSFALQPWVIGLAAFVPPIIYTVKRKRLDKRLKYHLGLIFMTVIIIALSIFTPTSLCPFHLVIVYPFQQVVIVSAVLIAVHELRLTEWRRWFAWGTIGLTLATNMLVTVGIHQVLVQTGGAGMWSSAIYDLNDYLQSADKPVICMDWGLCNPLQALSRGALRTSDEWKAYLYPVNNYQPLVASMKKGALFIFHSPRYTGVCTITGTEDYPRQNFMRAAKSAGLKVQIIQTITQKNGDPLYEVYRAMPM